MPKDWNDYNDCAECGNALTYGVCQNAHDVSPWCENCGAKLIAPWADCDNAHCTRPLGSHN